MSFIDAMMSKGKDNDGMFFKDDFQITDARVYIRKDDDGDIELVMALDSNVQGWARGGFVWSFRPEPIDELSEGDVLGWKPCFHVKEFVEGESLSHSGGYRVKHFKNVSKFTGLFAFGSPDGSVLRKRLAIDHNVLTGEWQKLESVDA